MRCIKILHWIFIRVLRVNSTSCFTTSQERQGTWFLSIIFHSLRKKVCYIWELYSDCNIKYDMHKWYDYGKIYERSFKKLKSFYIHKMLLICWCSDNLGSQKRAMESPVRVHWVPLPFCLHVSEIHKPGVTYFWGAISSGFTLAELGSSGFLIYKKKIGQAIFTNLKNLWKLVNVHLL